MLVIAWLTMWLQSGSARGLSIKPWRSSDDTPMLAAAGDSVCNPGGTQVLYTGIRAFSTTIYGWPVRHNWYLVRCESGCIVAEQYFPAYRTANFSFGKPMCFEADDCVIIGRRKKFAEREVTVYRPYTLLGTISSYDAISQDILPIGVIVCDVMTHTLTISGETGAMTRLVPLFFTPQRRPGLRDASARSAALALKVDPYEEYIYTDDDREQLWHYANVAINDLWHLVSYVDKLAFWEFDALQRQLNGGHDWRRFANKAIPDTHRLSNRLHAKLKIRPLSLTPMKRTNATYAK